MKLLDRYLGGRFLATFLRTVLALVLLFILIDLLTNLRKDVGRHDIPYRVVAEYYLFSTPQILFRYQLVSLGVLVAGLLVLGNASQHNEITAALAGGIGLGKIIRMPGFIALAVTCGAFLLQETVAPYASQRVEAIRDQYLSQSGKFKRTGVSWTHLPGNWSCHVMKFNRVAMSGQDVFMHSIRDDAVEQIQANRIYWDAKEHRWMLEDGNWYIFDPQEGWKRQGFRITQWPAPIAPEPADLFALEDPPETKSARQLLDDLKRAEARGMPVDPYWVEFHSKFAQPALAFIMIWLAVPFAIQIRRGGLAVGFGISVAVAVAYIIVYRVCLGLGYMGQMPPFLSAWFANFAFMALGLFLYRRTAT